MTVLTATTLDRPTGALLRPGDRVEVRNRFDGRWSPGFRVAAVVADDDGYHFRVRRLSDGAVLPALFSEDMVVDAR